MQHVGIELLVFSTKTFILLVFVLLLLAGILALIGRGKEKTHGRIHIKNLNKKYQETTQSLLQEISPKKQFKKFLKQQKEAEKAKQKAQEESSLKNVFLLHFQGDLKASAVSALREEITAILGIAQPQDEVVVCVESGGGMVHAYGLATAQLQRIKSNKIKLTVIVDKIAASGGYLMSCVADQVLAAPFAIIGSIGVIVQIPNFHRVLQDKNVEFEQLTAGSYKRTLTMFGQNTEEGRQKLQDEIEVIHQDFKQVIIDHRKNIDITKVATGEHWLGTQALELHLVDALTTSDDYLLEQSKHANLYEISYEMKKSFLTKLTGAASKIISPIGSLFFRY